MTTHRAYQPIAPKPPPCSCGLAGRMLEWLQTEAARADADAKRYATTDESTARYFAGRRDVLECDALRELLGEVGTV
jgi:hypothetical protein